MRSQKEIADREQDVDRLIVKYKYGESIYHYTSMASLIGILRNKELWLNNTATMNDKSEIVHFISKMQKAVLEDINSEKIDDCNLFFTKLFDRLKHEYPFAICFSTFSDNAAQWERYADNARGVCIKFNTSTFMNLFFYSGAIFNKVFYEDNVRLHEHYDILKEYFNTGILKKLENETNEMDNLLAVSYMYKHESFSTESEIRLSTLWRREIAESEFSFEMINGRIKKILKISLEKLCNEESIDFEDLIDGIVVAPRSDQNELELMEYLDSLGYKKLSSRVSKSQCPLR